MPNVTEIVRVDKYGKTRQRLVSRGRPVKYDWNHFRILYIKGDDQVTLESISKLPDAPGEVHLRVKSAKEGWRELRQDFRVAVADEMQSFQNLIGLEVRQRQVELARAGQAIVSRVLSDPDAIEKSLSKNPTALATFAKTFADLERKALGLDEARLDMRELSDEQLQRIAAGEDPLKVLKRSMSR